MDPRGGAKGLSFDPMSTPAAPRLPSTAGKLRPCSSPFAFPAAHPLQLTTPCRSLPLAARHSLFQLPTPCSSPFASSAAGPTPCGLPFDFSAAHPLTLQLAIRFFSCPPLAARHLLLQLPGPPLAACHSIFQLPTPCSSPFAFSAAHPLQLAVRSSCSSPFAFSAAPPCSLPFAFSASHRLQLASCPPLAACHLLFQLVFIVVEMCWFRRIAAAPTKQSPQMLTHQKFQSIGTWYFRNILALQYSAT